MNVFQMLAKRMDYDNRSLELTAENLTNKYTPLYKARRLGPLKFDPSSAAEGTLQVTHPGHITSQMKAGFRVVQKSGGVETFSGNTVSQDEELPGAEAYRRRITVFKNYVDPRTGTNIPLLEKIGVDTAPFGKYYDPSHPAANAQGMVLQPNVNRYFETADFQESNLLMAACSRLYEAASIVIQRTHDLMIKA